MAELKNSKTSEQKTRIDGGYGWVIVYAAFMVHLLISGILYSFGVLYTEFLDAFNQGKGNTAWISSLLPGIMLFVGPIAGALTSRFGCRAVVMIGATIAASGFVLSSFATSLFYLYFSFGIIPGVGFGLVVLPALVSVNRHFKKKRSLAIGITVSGSGVGIFTFAQLVRFFINEYGWRGTFLIEAGVAFNIVVFGSLLKPMIYSHNELTLEIKKKEIKEEEKRRNKNRTGCNQCSFFVSHHFEFRLLTEPVFLIFTASHFLTALGYIAPYTYLPDRAEEKGIDKSDSAFLISTMGITSLIGRLVFGWIADYKHVNRLYLFGVSILLCGIANLLNPVDDSYEYLLVYAAIQGMFGGVFISLNSVVLADLIGLERLDKGLGLLTAFGGIGSLIGNPIAGWLYDGTGSYDVSFYFLGCCMSLGGILPMFIPVLQMISKNRYKSQLKVDNNNVNVETIQTRF